MERREFIKKSCALCASIAAGGMLASTLSSCASFPVYETTSDRDIVGVPASLFTAAAIRIIRIKNYYYDVALKKGDDGTYTALVLACTHASNPLTFTGDKFTCPLHGSMFDENGMVTHGPASKPLQRLRVDVLQEAIRIIIPSFGG